MGYYHSAASIYNMFYLKVPLSQLSRYAIKYPEISVLESGQFAAMSSTLTSPWMSFFRADFPYTHTNILHLTFTENLHCKGKGIIKHMCYKVPSWKPLTLTGLCTVLLTQTTMMGGEHWGERILTADCTILNRIGCTNGRKSREFLFGDKKDVTKINTTQLKTALLKDFSPPQASSTCCLHFHWGQFQVCPYKSRAQCSPLSCKGKVSIYPK